MPKYIVWYKKEVKAKNIKEAVAKEKRTKAVFHSLVEEEPKDITQGVSAIGFEMSED